MEKAEKLVGISTFSLQAKYGDLRAIELAAKVGADAIDFSTENNSFLNKNNIYSKSDEEIYNYFSKLKSKSDELGITISQTHGRISGFKNIPSEDEALMRNHRLDCIATKALGAPVCVIHNPTTIYLTPDAPAELMHELAFNQLSQMVEICKQYDLVLATETFGDAASYNCCDFFGNISEFLTVYNRVKALDGNEKHMKICVDTGHSHKATRFSNPPVADVIRLCGKDIVALHLHDNDTLADQHKTPLTGSINWTDVLAALNDVEYCGVYNMEIALTHFGDDFMVEEASFAVKVMKHILSK